MTNSTISVVSDQARIGLFRFLQLSLFTLLLLSFPLLAAAQNCTGNLLQNPGLEAGLSGWSGGASISTDANNGTNAIEICPGTTARQTMAATVGSNYTFSFWGKNSSSSVQTYGRIKFLTSSWQPISEELVAVTSTNYAEYSVENPAPAGTAWVEISIRKSGSSSGCTLADDLCLNTAGGNTGGGGGGGGGGTCGNNMLDNPGFESNFDDWNGTGLANSSTTASGTNALKLCANKNARQTIPYTAGETLTLIFKARTEGGGTNVLSYIKYLSASWQPLVTEFNNYNPNTTYTEVSFSKTAPPGTAHVQVGFINNSANCYLIDDVCLSEDGGTTGACSFLKTYFPAVNGYSGVSNPQPLNKNGNSLQTWSFDTESGSSTGTLKSLKTDLSGNVISQTESIADGYALTSYNQTLQIESGDFITISLDVNLPKFTKIDASGSEVWSSTITEYAPNNPNNNIFSASIIQDGSGFIGAFSNPNGFTNPATGEVTLIKVDAAGNYLWQRTITDLGVTYPAVSFIPHTGNGVYARIGTADGNKIYRFNSSTGNQTWITPAFNNSASDYRGAVITSDGAVAVLWRAGFGIGESTIRRFSGNTGAPEGAAVTINDLINEDASATLGLLATDDGGVIFSGAFNFFFPGGTNPDQNNRILKLDNNLNLVWEKQLPFNWLFGPKQVATDGSIFFIGSKGSDFGILKTTSTGDISPACDNDCVIEEVTISDLNCNDSGTPTDPLDDTYSFSVLITSEGNCAGSWVGNGVTGTYGVPTTVSGFLIDDGLMPVSFANASNPETSVYSLEVSPPTPCSDQPLGCGFEETYNNTLPGLAFQPPFAENLANGGFKLSAQVGASGDYQELTLNDRGEEQNYIEETVNGKRFRTLDGNYIAAEFVNGTSIVINKTNAVGNNNIFTNTISITTLTNAFYTDPTVVKVVEVSDGYVIAGSYDYQPIPNQAPEQVFFAVKTNLNGTKLFQTQVEVTDYPYYVGQFIVGDSGNFYFLLTSNADYILYKFDESGDELWSRNVLGDLPSSDFVDFHEAADGHMYATRYDNSFGYVLKLDGDTGNSIWQFSSAFLPIPNNSTIFGYPNGSLSTPDGGAVFAMGYSIPGSSTSGYVIGRLSPSGQLVWHRTFMGNYSHRPVLVTDDGGYLFAGTLTTGEYGIFKTTSTGELLPSCTGGGGNQADLTLADLTLNSGSLPAGAVLDYSFDLKNIGTAGTGSYNIKAYISIDAQLSSDDIQDGTIPTGNLEANTTISNVPGASTIPASLSPGNYFLILKADADETVAESNENNNILVSQNPFTVSPSNNSGPDLELSLSASPMNPGQWKSSNFSLEITNSGTEAATGIKVDFMNQSDPTVSSVVAYQNHTAPAGTSFNSWNGIWTVGTLASGASVTLTYKGFCKTNNEVPVFSQVSETNTTDQDSSPGNNNNGIPSEDDEALVVLNASANSNFSSSEVGEDGRISFIVYPNPVGETLKVRLSKSYPSVKMTLVNNLGFVMLEKEVEEPQEIEKLDMRSIPNGQYFLKVASPDARALVRKVVVMRTY